MLNCALDAAPSRFPRQEATFAILEVSIPHSVIPDMEDKIAEIVQRDSKYEGTLTSFKRWERGR